MTSQEYAKFTRAQLEKWVEEISTQVIKGIHNDMPHNLRLNRKQKEKLDEIIPSNLKAQINFNLPRFKDNPTVENKIREDNEELRREHEEFKEKLNQEKEDFIRNHRKAELDFEKDEILKDFIEAVKLEDFSKRMAEIKEKIFQGILIKEDELMEILPHNYQKTNDGYLIPCASINDMVLNFFNTFMQNICTREASTGYLLKDVSMLEKANKNIKVQLSREHSSGKAFMGVFILSLFENLILRIIEYHPDMEETGLDDSLLAASIVDITSPMLMYLKHSEYSKIKWPNLIVDLSSSGDYLDVISSPLRQLQDFQDFMEEVSDTSLKEALETDLSTRTLKDRIKKAQSRIGHIKFPKGTVSFLNYFGSQVYDKVKAAKTREELLISVLVLRQMEAFYKKYLTG